MKTRHANPATPATSGSTQPRPRLSLSPCSRLLAAVLVIACAAPLQAQQTAPSSPTAQNAAPDSATVELREVDQTWPAEAVVEAVKQATLAAQVTGRIVEVRVDAGARVKAGDVLMRIDAREAAEALAGAQAQFANAKANLARVKNLHSQKFVSQAALDKAEADYKTAAASAAQAGAASGHSVIVAPFAGIVAQRLAEPGEMANPGRPLISLFEPKGMRVVASIPQYKLSELNQARTALRGKIEFPGSGRWLDATRIEILPTADAASHAVRVRLYLPDNLDTTSGIVPGVFARAHFVVGKARKLLVPASAVLRRGELTGLYVLDEKGQPRLRQVRLGEVFPGPANGDIEILAGLNPGERIALDPIKAGFQTAKPR